MNGRSLLVDTSAVREIVGRIGRDVLMDTLVGRLTDAIRAFDPAVASVPAREGVRYTTPAFGLLEWMPAYLGSRDILVKIVGYHPTNPDARRLPTVISSMCLFDTETGHLTAMIDGTFLTAVRTGAASTVASRVLASPDSRTLGVIGCGAQAVTQIHALARMFPLEQVLVCDIAPEVALSLVDRVRFVEVPVQVIPRERLTELVTAADILCTCTSAAPGEGPVFRDCTTQPHLHVNAVGSDFPGKFELPVTLLRRALVCPDFREQATVEGECQQLESSEIGPDLCTLVQRASHYERSRGELTVFDSTGWALEDYVSASMMVGFAREFGLGQEIELECLPPDPRDPYSLVESAVAGICARVPALSRF
jgi:ornithine cyclodeaminase/alanine dehydrogenase-like protein (mu-crystallin family)